MQFFESRVSPSLWTSGELRSAIVGCAGRKRAQPSTVWYWRAQWRLRARSYFCVARRCARTATLCFLEHDAFALRERLCQVDAVIAERTADRWRAPASPCASATRAAASQSRLAAGVRTQSAVGLLRATAPALLARRERLRGGARPAVRVQSARRRGGGAGALAARPRHALLHAAEDVSASVCVAIERSFVGRGATPTQSFIVFPCTAAVRRDAAAILERGHAGSTSAGPS